MKDGGGTFRARFGVERVIKTKVMENGQEVEKEEKHNLLAEGSYSVGSEIQDGYPEFTMGVLKKLGWDKDLHASRAGRHRDRSAATTSTPCRGRPICPAASSASRWSTAASPTATARRAPIAWNLPDPIPVHREPIYTPRIDLVAKYPTLPDAARVPLPNLGFTVQKAERRQEDRRSSFPLILTSGRLVEYEGGGEETRSNKWLAELQQDMFVEINPADAAARGIKDGGWVWVTGPENDSKARMKALVTERVGKGVAWMPFHFAGWFEGVDQRSKYPKGADPIVLGESVNTLTTYGYDPVTGMQEPKATLCQIRAA